MQISDLRKFGMQARCITRTRDLKISNQIILTQFIIFVCLFAMGISCYFSVYKLLKNNETLRNHPVVTQGAVSSIVADIYNIRLLMQGIILGEADSIIQSKADAIDSYQADVVKQLDILAVSYLGAKSDLETLNGDIVFYHAIRNETLLLQSIGKMEEARKRVEFGGICETQVEKIIITAIVMENFAVNKAEELYRESQQQARWLLLICLIIL
jgi:CHASE3 domain sensor protein